MLTIIDVPLLLFGGFGVLLIATFIAAAFSDFIWDGPVALAVFFICLFVGVTIVYNNAATDEAEKAHYLKFEEAYEMDCKGWQHYFKDAAAFSKLQFVMGGDKENGEMAMYYQREAEKSETCKDALMAPRGGHPTLDEYRTYGKGGWDGKYPWQG